jgi:hypothetical protein
MTFVPANGLSGRGVESLHSGGHYDIARIETVGNDDRPRIVAQNVDISHGHGQARRINNPDGGLPIEPGEGGGGNRNYRSRIQLDAPVNRRTQSHGWRRVTQSDLDLKGSGDGISLLSDLAHQSHRCYGGILRQVHCDRPITRRRTQQLGGYIEHRIPSFLPSDPHNHLARLHDLSGFRASGRDRSGRVRLELSVAHAIASDF